MGSQVFTSAKKAQVSWALEAAPGEGVGSWLALGFLKPWLMGSLIKIDDLLLECTKMGSTHCATGPLVYSLLLTLQHSLLLVESFKSG